MAVSQVGERDSKFSATMCRVRGVRFKRWRPRPGLDLRVGVGETRLYRCAVRLNEIGLDAGRSQRRFDARHDRGIELSVTLALDT
jgi:hypothetical protein